MQVTILLNNNDLEIKDNEIGKLIINKSQFKLYYDASLGLFYRNNKYKIEILATKLDVKGLEKIRKEILKIKGSNKNIVVFNLNVWLIE